ncbi:MAG TPA: hypothetical protein VKX17_28315 [Planctomycetota bacterium]|nr:hypothetical protein [Planctomycetota bacterium]
MPPSALAIRGVLQGRPAHASLWVALAAFLAADTAKYFHMARLNAERLEQSSENTV